jgi:hypothetical protein
MWHSADISPTHDTAHIITQLDKIHSQMVGLATNLMYQVAGFTCSFVCCIGLQPDGVIHSSSPGDVHQLVFYHVRYENQPTITVGPQTRAVRYQPFGSVHNARHFSECYTTTEATKHVRTTSFP